MKSQRIALGVTILNLIILSIVLTRQDTVRAQGNQPHKLPMLRGSGLELVDSLGRLRAMIRVEPPVVVDGKQYPETVLLRLIDDQGKPQVKLTAAAGGSAMSMSSDGDGGVQILARNSGTLIKLSNNDGREQVFKP